MSIEMSKIKRIFFIATIFLSNIIIMNSYILSPTVNALYALYPNNIGLVNFIVTGSTAIIIVASPIASKFCNIVSKKTLMIFGAVCATIGGVFLLAINNAIWIGSMRLLVSIGYAFTQVAVIGLIAEVYTDPEKSNSMVGYNNAAMTGIGAIIGLIAGILAVTSINACYMLHWSIAAYMVLVIIFVPNIKPQRIAEGHDGTEETTKAAKEGLGAKYWTNILNYVLYSFAFMIFVWYVSMYVAENNLGTEAVTGVLNSVSTIAGFFCGLAYGWLFKKFGKHSIAAYYVLSVVAFLMLWKMPSLGIAYLGMGILGGACTALSSYAFGYCPSFVPKSRINDAIAYITSLTNAVGFTIAYAVTFSMSAMKTTKFTPTLILPVVIVVINTVVQFLINMKEKAN